MEELFIFTELADEFFDALFVEIDFAARGVCALVCEGDF